MAFVIEELRLGPAVVIGQSLGGQLALIFAARHPELVRGVVLADASPAGAGGSASAAVAAAEVAASLRRWPMPFPTREAAVSYFAARFGSLAAEAWADGLEQRDGGWWPAFDVDVMERTLRSALTDDHWGDWERIRCPALVVRAGAGIIPASEGGEMVDRLPGARLVELPGAAHDLHLDQPVQWREAVSAFLAELR